MSWFTTSDYFIMDAVARSRAEELRERNAIAYVPDDDPHHDAPAQSAEPARPAPASCPLARKAA